jgi:hypothetical protein
VFGLAQHNLTQLFAGTNTLKELYFLFRSQAIAAVYRAGDLIRDERTGANIRRI